MASVRRRFWLEIAFSAGSVAVLAPPLLYPPWIEAIFGIDPDRGSGSLEWTIATTLALAMIICAASARFEWRRALRLGAAPAEIGS
jgi:hypothetical protein